MNDTPATPLPEGAGGSHRSRRRASLLDRAIVKDAALGAVRKLDPRSLARNPVMFVVAVVAVLATVLFVRDIVTGAANLGVSAQIVAWLWITVLFANFAEAVAKGRGKAQAASLRRTRTETAAE
jgi:K+-transporting ATPase ATPase B chain